jgi:hypothetical protein
MVQILDLQGIHLPLEGLPFSLKHPTSFIPCQPAECRLKLGLTVFSHTENSSISLTLSDIYYLFICRQTIPRKERVRLKKYFYRPNLFQSIAFRKNLFKSLRFVTMKAQWLV